MNKLLYREAKRNAARIRNSKFSSPEGLGVTLPKDELTRRWRGESWIDECWKYF